MTFDLSIIQWLLIFFTALLIGLAKTGIPALGILVVTMMAMIFPARDSIGIVLPMLIIGDLVAVTYYRRSVEWKLLWRLVPWVLGGIVLGFLLLFTVTDSRAIEVILGIIISSMVVLQIKKEFSSSNSDQKVPRSRFFLVFMGTLGGFTTMIGNAAGPVMAIFFIAMALPKTQFIGTGAWFYLTVNLIKVPLLFSLGLISGNSLTLNAMMLPAILIGTAIGVRLVPLIPQQRFNQIVLLLSFAGALALLI
ncbi:sulfite exporter TauE/SafE family protein [Salisediminibacterium beveridgei]|uniref:Probable membrane transporter protein n=1 Tax=Salisediminibacterium beveridgei TaxID=632773 RepID=A0A1D7QZ30_9BACI|nr:sulfite exporter TauE/SafE family protein [Salisediminibacterium beveridgei]AOM84210.1 hypothetical protein BBEV_2885 [Salisediminibacterium beveridgei]